MIKSGIVLLVGTTSYMRLYQIKISSTGKNVNGLFQKLQFVYNLMTILNVIAEFTSTIVSQSVTIVTVKVELFH